MSGLVIRGSYKTFETNRRTGDPFLALGRRQGYFLPWRWRDWIAQCRSPCSSGAMSIGSIGLGLGLCSRRWPHLSWSNRSPYAADRSASRCKKLHSKDVLRIDRPLEEGPRNGIKFESVFQIVISASRRIRWICEYRSPTCGWVTARTNQEFTWVGWPSRETFGRRGDDDGFQGYVLCFPLSFPDSTTISRAQYVVPPVGHHAKCAWESALRSPLAGDRNA